MNIWPPGCAMNGCKHHYPPARNLAAEGCICPAWFDGDGWHVISANPDCAAHQAAHQPAARTLT